MLAKHRTEAKAGVLRCCTASHRGDPLASAIHGYVPHTPRQPLYLSASQAYGGVEIRWIFGSENLFLTTHVDGLLVVYDKETQALIKGLGVRVLPLGWQVFAIGAILEVLGKSSERHYLYLYIKRALEKI